MSFRGSRSVAKVATVTGEWVRNKRAAWSFAVASVTAIALLAPAGALANTVQLYGKTGTGSGIRLDLLPQHLVPDYMRTTVVMRCTNGHSYTVDIAMDDFNVSRHVTTTSTSGPKRVTYSAHSSLRGYHLAMSVNVAQYAHGHIYAHGTFNVSHTTTSGVPCDTGGNVTFTANHG